MRRREFMTAFAASLSLTSGCAPKFLAGEEKLHGQTVLFLPGYHPRRVSLVGEPADSRRRRTSDGAQTLVTRISSDGDVRQAVFPIIGHDIAISVDGRFGFLGRMNLGGGEGAAHHVAFDAQSLEMIEVGHSLGLGWGGGGHGLFLSDNTILCSERAPDRPFTGRRSDHYGRISLRDPMTLRVLDSFSTQGIAPHEMRLSDDGRHIVVANYGSVAGAPKSDPVVRRPTIQPSITKLNIAEGRLVSQYLVPDPALETRHLALGKDGKIFVIRAHPASPGENTAWLRSIAADTDELPVNPNSGESYLPAAPVLLDEKTGSRQTLALSEPEAHLLEGLSVEFEPLYNEFIASFPSSHRLLVFSGNDGGIVRSIDMRDHGIVRPSGITLLPDSNLYIVAGYWQGLAVLERGTHRVVQNFSSTAPVTGGHSHMTAATFQLRKL